MVLSDIDDDFCKPCAVLLLANEAVVRDGFDFVVHGVARGIHPLAAGFYGLHLGATIAGLGFGAKLAPAECSMPWSTGSMER